MLFLLFQLGGDRYALPVNQVIEVLPLVEIKSIPLAPPGVSGIFNYRGTPVPVIDISQMTIGRPAELKLSTRIVLVKYDELEQQVVGLLAERATQLLRRDPKEFYDPGVSVASAPYLGQVTTDGTGLIQRIELVALLSGAVKKLLFPSELQRIE